MRNKTLTAAAMLLAALTLAACGGDEKLSGDVRDEYVDKCKSGGAPAEFCECQWDELDRQGVDTENKLRDLAEKSADAAKSGDPAGNIPEELRKAIEACRDKLGG
jgi:hypothetical protein